MKEKHPSQGKMREKNQLYLLGSVPAGLKTEAKYITYSYSKKLKVK
jgi:hypothetical protein